MTPTFIKDQTHFDGERIVGWRRITQPAAGDATRTIPVGAQLVTESGIYEFDLEGIGTRASVLHPTDYEYLELP